jgi:hypothetical protein
MEDNPLPALLDETASDAALGPSTIDLDQLIATARRGALRRRIAVGGTLAAVLAGVGVGVPAMRGWLGTPTVAGTTTTAARPAPNGAVPGRAATPAAPAAQGDRTLVELVQRTIPGSRVTLQPPTRRSDGKATVVNGTYQVGGRTVARITITAAAQRPVAITYERATNPCTLPPGSPPSRQGAPGPASQCKKYTLSNGSTVWVWRVPSGDVGIALSTKDWQVTNLRSDGTWVVVNVDKQKPTNRPGAAPADDASNWTLSESALVEIASSPVVHP